MIQKFKKFDDVEFIRKKSALNKSSVNESLFADDEDFEKTIFGGIPDNTMVMPKDDSSIDDENVITLTPVYTDKYLSKISDIVIKKLNGLSNGGKFVMAYNIVYLNGVPGVLFTNDEDKLDIICCRDRNKKVIAVFKNFKINDTNKAIVTYSTEKIGFTDMIKQMIEELSNSVQMNESLILEAGGFGDGYSEKNIKNFMRLSPADKKYIYDLVSSKKKGDAILHMKSGLASKDPTIMRILTTFGAQGANNGSAKYIVGLALDIMNDRYSAESSDFAALVKEYNSSYAGGGVGPVVSVSSGDDYEVTDDENNEAAEREKAWREAEEQRLKKEYEKYMNTIQGLEDTVRAMCNYVKQSGQLDADDRSAMSRRGIILTGKGGIGKTKTLKTVLKERKMIKNKDFVWVSSERVTADKLYTLMYEYNGKLIVFDDTGDIFDGKYNGPLWKTALQTELDDCEIGYPGATSKLKVYNDRVLKDRQRRYYAEIGSKSDEDKSEFYRAEMKKRGLRFRNGVVVSDDPTLQKSDIDLLMEKIDDLWKEESLNVRPSMPTHFIYTGVVVIISNMDREQFIDEMGRASWKALQSRFKNYDINPLAESLWAKMKKIILSEYNDSSIPDDKCAIPRNMTEEFIRVVEDAIANNKAEGLTFRTIVAYGMVLRGKPGLRTWETDLRYELENG